MADIENNSDNRDLGPVTAYAMAVEGGYKGTYEEWIDLLGNFSVRAEEVKNNAETASTKASEALDSAVDSKKWAVGPSGTGSGTDDNNSKFYAEQAEANGKKWAVGPNGTGDGTDDNNAKFWSDKAKEYADEAKSVSAIQPATTTNLGAVIVGTGLQVAEDGTISIPTWGALIGK